MKGKISKLVFGVAFLLVGCFILSGALSADEGADLVAKGRALFSDKAALGTKFTCIMCHKPGKEVKKAKIEKAGDQLPTLVNKYVVEKAKGKALAADSQEMKALIAYMKAEHAK